MTTAVCRSVGGCDDLDRGSVTGVLRQCRLTQPHLDGTNPSLGVLVVVGYILAISTLSYH